MFIIKGVDYQPGGSSGITPDQDPLSNPETCCRDIVLFQNLGINTIRVYSINTNLNHDVCMSLLAAAGIYLILDVNSPLTNRHLNRYEPWSSYNQNYLSNVFQVVEQFSTYNNTLGFFAGNEIINDQLSAKNSPVYIKALIRDIKNYISINSPRFVPVGYSAADDLSYRMPVSEYLECVEHHPSEAIDFYGVNSYQWCGDQDIHSSGYDILINDYKQYSKPVFFSEYGCNEVLPRTFTEVKALYSNQMIDVFCGGLVYEFSQEPNNYGLVKIRDNNDVELLSDYFQYQYQLDTIPAINFQQIKKNLLKHQNQVAKSKKPPIHKCLPEYKNIDISLGVPKNVDGIGELIQRGSNVTNGKLIEVDLNDFTNKFNIFANQNQPYLLPNKIARVSNFEIVKNPNNSEFDTSSTLYSNKNKPLSVQVLFSKVSAHFRRMGHHN